MRRGSTSAAGRPPAAGRGAAAVVALAAVCSLAQGPAPALAASANWPGAYRTAPDALRISGAASAEAGGPRLEEGTYVDTISAGERKYYRVVLDDTSNAYVSAVLAPPPGSRVRPTDGIRVSLESPDGARCSVRNDITFGGSTPLPVADYSTRRIGQGRECQAAGEYLYTVEWIGGGESDSTAKGWTVELKHMSEPGLKEGTAGPVTPTAPEDRGDPERASGPATPVTGGSGFNDAHPIGHGVWSEALNPGDSRFYRVPVEWGQRLLLDAEFGDGGTPGRPGGGLRVTVFNTARGFVENTAEPYRGRPGKLSLDTERAVFGNRTSDHNDISGMRFSGPHYLRVSLDRKAPGPLPVTLRLTLDGERAEAPAYLSDPVAAGFGITEDDREEAMEGRADDDDPREALLTAVGITGIGLGSALLLTLLGWTAAARLARPRGRHASTGEPRP
ncbi:hypothetical protein GCM10010232_30540 [Streptomyces amakusaensis]|uniref:Uncharacterized protein n=1 Tax=Streptomyces amakusaensis TaxID=67271 RepID=A0ABW0AG19_9ACTN